LTQAIELPVAHETWNQPEKEEFALIVKGGSTKGLAYLGALSVLYQHGFVPSAVAGSSAGAITAFVLACAHAKAKQPKGSAELGTPPTKLTDGIAAEGKREQTSQIDLEGALRESFQELAGLDPAAEFFGLRLPDSLFLGFRLLFRGHLAPGRGLASWMKRCLEPLEKSGPDVTLSDLEVKSGLRLFLARSSTKEGVGFVNSSCSVIEAVRGSAALPFGLEPVKAQEGAAGEPDTWIDGGLLQNLPIPLYEEKCAEGTDLPQQFLALHLDPTEPTTGGQSSVQRAASWWSRLGAMLLKPMGVARKVLGAILPELAGLVLIALTYLALQRPELALTQSQKPDTYYGHVAARSFLYLVSAGGVALLARRLLALFMSVGILRTASHVLSAVAAQNAKKVLEEAKRRNQLIPIPTGTSIGTFTLLLSEDQRKFLILSGAKSALKYVKDSGKPVKDDVWLPLPGKVNTNKMWTRSQIETMLEEAAEESQASSGARLRLGLHLVAGVAPVLIAAFVAVMLVHFALFNRSHHLGGSLKESSSHKRGEGAGGAAGACTTPANIESVPPTVTVIHAMINAGCSSMAAASGVAGRPSTAGAAGAEGAVAAQSGQIYCDNACQAGCALACRAGAGGEGGATACEYCKCACPKNCKAAQDKQESQSKGAGGSGASNACYQHAEIALGTAGSEIEDCFYVGGGVFPADIVETLCWTHVCSRGGCNGGDHDCRKEAKQRLTAEAANDCVAAFALWPQGWRAPTRP
jgi:predicted acylesterase/phospholipase RssA